MKKDLKLTDDDKRNFEQFQAQNPELFADHAPDYSKQVTELKKKNRADSDILAGKKMPQKANKRNTPNRSMTPDQHQKIKNYWDKVTGSGPLKNPMTFDTATKIIDQMIATFETKEQTKFHYDEYNKKVIHDLTRYFMNDHQGPLSTRKSIWLYGQMGTGKTLMARLFSDFTRAFNLHKKFHVVSAEDLAEQVKEDKSLKSLSTYTNQIHCIDDAGQEGVVKIYGEKVDIIERIIKKAYFDKKTLIITSNLAPSSVAKAINDALQAQNPEKMIKKVYSIESRYRDERTVDRIYEMFNFVPLFGANKRRLL